MSNYRSLKFLYFSRCFAFSEVDTPKKSPWKTDYQVIWRPEICKEAAAGHGELMLCNC